MKAHVVIEAGPPEAPARCTVHFSPSGLSRPDAQLWRVRVSAGPYVFALPLVTLCPDAPLSAFTAAAQAALDQAAGRWLDTMRAGL